MSAVLAALPAPTPARAAPAPVGIAVLGLGNVGRAFATRLGRLRESARVIVPPLCFVANSRGARAVEHAAEAWAAIEQLRSQATPSAAWRGVPRGALIVDATASEDVAAEHATWLEQGHAVVTANKLGRSGPQLRHDRIARAGGDRYGDCATVGAGLPILETVRRLRTGGDLVSSIAGVLSGTWNWLLDGYDGTAPFAARVLAAQALGYTEPDPRVDLAGADVCRKLVIVARAAGVELESAAVRIDAPIDASPGTVAEHALAAVERAVAERVRAATAIGRVLRFVARIDGDGARIGLEALAPDDPLAGGRGCDNRVVIRTCRYAASPLLIQGPGAGAEVTAAALLDDVVRLATARAS